MPDPAKELASKEADARAIGGACRHAGRGIEDCYTNNSTAGKSAVFAGWKEMNDYMRENQIVEIKPAAISTSPAGKSADTEKTAEPASGAKPGAH